MAGGEVVLDSVGRDDYHEQEHARSLPMLLEAGDPCVVRLDLSAFDRDSTPGTPTLSEFPAIIKAKLQNANRWSMLIVNSSNHDGTDEPTDYCITLDSDGLVRRLDDEPVLGDPMRSLDWASQCFDPTDQPGGYILPAELTLSLAQAEIDYEAIQADFDAGFAKILGGTTLSEQ